MFHTIFYVPLYNALIFLTSHLWGNLALGVIALTILVKVILSPLSHASIKSQIEQKKLQPHIDEIKNNYPDKKEQSARLMELYKEHKTSPFAGCLLLILQLPVIIALYRVFLGSGTLSADGLYSFVHLPDMVQTTFLGISMSARSIILAVVAGVTQFIQMQLSPAMKSMPKPANSDDKQAAMAASMTSSMKYTMPVMIIVFGYAVPAAVTLYWIVSNLFMILQEWVVANMMKNRA